MAVSGKYFRSKKIQKLSMTPFLTFERATLKRRDPCFVDNWFRTRSILVPKLKAKPIRTASGIAVVAVMCKPHRCPHINMTGNICVYCPGIVLHWFSRPIDREIHFSLKLDLLCYGVTDTLEAPSALLLAHEQSAETTVCLSHHYVTKQIDFNTKMSCPFCRPDFTLVITKLDQKTFDFLFNQ